MGQEHRGCIHAACHSLSELKLFSGFLSLQPSSGVASLHRTQVSAPTPWRAGSRVWVQVTLGRTTSTASRCLSSSPSSCGPSRIPRAATGRRTARHRCRHRRAAPLSWASTASASWQPVSSSAPSSGPETSRTSRSSRFQSRSGVKRGDLQSD